MTLFRGFPFPPERRWWKQIEPETGSHAPIVTGLKTGIDVVPMNERDETRYLVLQHVSGPPVNRATSMTVDERGGTGYITELSTGRIVALPLQ